MSTSLELIESKGVRALTLREIGSRLGVSRTAPYRHFADKRALLAALGAGGFKEFGNVLDQARRAATGTYLNQLDAMGAAYVQFAAQHGAHFEVMFGSGGEAVELDPEGAKAAERAFGILEETIRHGQAAGEIVDGNSVDLARMVWSLVHGISLLGFGSGSGSQHCSGSEFPPFCFAHLRAGIQKRSK
ncbi:MAG: TetR/AcrR family transcriptional regulator [Bryobacteraceae bacterium]